MSHRTYRHVDTPVPYLGLTWRQWLLIVSCAALALAVIDLLHPPTPIALWLGTVLLTGPVAVSYFTSGASVSFGRMLLDHARWLLAPRELAPSRAVEHVRARGFMVAAPPARATTIAGLSPQGARVPIEWRPAAPGGPERRRSRRPSLGRARALDRGVPGQPPDP